LVIWYNQIESSIEKVVILNNQIKSYLI
jgi:hypothetical protein